MSSTQIFLSITIGSGPVGGEASAAGYEDMIELESFSFGLSAKHALRQSANNTRPQLNYDAVKISKVYDVSSVRLATHMGARARFSKAEIFVDQHLQESASVKKQNPVMVIELKNGFIEDIRLSVSTGKLASTVREDISLSFVNFKIRYYPSSVVRGKRLPLQEFESRRIDT